MKQVQKQLQHLETELLRQFPELRVEHLPKALEEPPYRVRVEGAAPYEYAVVDGAVQESLATYGGTVLAQGSFVTDFDLTK